MHSVCAASKPRPSSAARRYQEKRTMSDIEKIIEADTETEASEENRDAIITEGAKITRPNQGRSTVYSPAQPRRGDSSCNP